jgi:hypothetical protein
MTCCCRALRGVFSQTINFGQDFLQNGYPKGQWGIAWVANSWIAICHAPFYYALRTRAAALRNQPSIRTNSRIQSRTNLASKLIRLHHLSERRAGNFPLALWCPTASAVHSTDLPSSDRGRTTRLTT